MTIAPFSAGDSCNSEMEKMEPVTIYVDSQETIKAIKSSALKSRVTFECKKVILGTYELGKLCTVKPSINYCESCFEKSLIAEDEGIWRFETG